MQPVVLLADGRLRVPCVEHDPEAGGLAHIVEVIGPDSPDYPRLRATAVTEPELARLQTSRADQQQELDRYLDDHRDDGEAMLHLLELQVQRLQRPAS